MRNRNRNQLTLQYQSFNGDYKALSHFLTDTWDRSFGRNHFQFSETYLKFLFEVPGTIPAFLTTCYDAGKIVGFIGPVIRHINYRQSVYKIIDMLLNSISPDYAAQNIMSGLFKELQNNIQRSAIKPYLISGFPFARLARIIIRRWVYGSFPIRISMQRYCKYLSARTEKQIIPPYVAAFKADHLEDCLKLANDTPSQATISLRWSRDELHHFLKFEKVSNTYVYQQGNQVRAFINFSISPTHGKKEVFHAYILNMCLGRLTQEQQVEFINGVLAKLKQQRVEFVMFYHAFLLTTEQLAELGFKKLGDDFEFMLGYVSEHTPQYIAQSTTGEVYMPIV